MNHLNAQHPSEMEYREDETVDEIMNSPYSKLKPRPAPPASSLAAAGLAKVMQLLGKCRELLCLMDLASLVLCPD